jgi:hypothetical protein
MHALATSNRSRSLPQLACAFLLTAIGCGGGGGGTSNGSSSAGGEPSGGDTSRSGQKPSAGESNAGDGADGGDTSSGGDTSKSGAPNGGTDSGGAANAGAGGEGNATGARSCEKDCADLANTSCAEADFSIETCKPKCEQEAQKKIDDAREIGCLIQYLSLDLCRVDDPVCTHPNPAECVEENDAYVLCLENAL